MKIHKSEAFNFDDLNWSEAEIAKVKANAEACCAEHNGEVQVVNGHVSHYRNEPYYAVPEDWPRYIVSWEEEA